MEYVWNTHGIGMGLVMEYAWKNGLMDFAMPFLIQFISDANNKLKEIDERTKPKDEGNEEMVNQQMMESQMYGQGMLALPDQGMGMGMMPGQMGQMGGMPQGNMGGMPGQGMGMGMPGQMPTGNMGMNNNMGGMPNMGPILLSQSISNAIHSSSNSISL